MVGEGLGRGELDVVGLGDGLLEVVGEVVGGGVGVMSGPLPPFGPPSSMNSRPITPTTATAATTMPMISPFDFFFGWGGGTPGPP
ncbi:hypothetical protein CGZ93_03180 [Enemella dayhoffiae]|uniref:Uncharacterized protein n=1 Tax=Enemella dayhoffiae TaxID=2016507 RepID=A0A255HAQ1_9ACTN|nr:hypothetical protein CGZ93_03180 [Enemella dayhoffiae]